MSDFNIQKTEAQENSPLRAEPAISLTVIDARAISRAHPAASPEALELHNRLKIRSEICRFLIKALGFSTACCFALIFLQGFHAWGFQMSESFLQWLCGATIVQLVAFLGIFTRAVWGKPVKKALKSGPKKV